MCESGGSASGFDTGSTTLPTSCGFLLQNDFSRIFRIVYQSSCGPIRLYGIYFCVQSRFQYPALYGDEQDRVNSVPTFCCDMLC
jgi:hypothetical protein